MGAGAGQYYFHQFSVKQPDLNWEKSQGAPRDLRYDPVVDG